MFSAPKSPKIIKYQLVMHANRNELINQVNNYLAEGWVPTGGIEIDRAPTAMFWQAMVLHENNWAELDKQIAEAVEEIKKTLPLRLITEEKAEQVDRMLIDSGVIDEKEVFETRSLHGVRMSVSNLRGEDSMAILKSKSSFALAIQVGVLEQIGYKVSGEPIVDAADWHTQAMRPVDSGGN